MLKALIKSTNEIRVETKEDADELHRSLEQTAADDGYTLSAWSETYRTRKSGGEIVEEWYICKYTLVFNDAKSPDRFGGDISYNFQTPIEENKMPWDEV